MNPEQIARITHEANRAYCMTIGDHSIPAWDTAPDWQKESAVNGVKYAFENSTSPEQSHENWLKEKESKGWKYGELKAPELLEHPCMLPWDKLPEEQKVKDSLFLAIIGVFANKEQPKIAKEIEKITEQLEKEILVEPVGLITQTKKNKYKK
jgi:hypothetical protein